MKRNSFFLMVVLCFAGMTIRAQQRLVLFEEFTSSTCGPCAQMNQWLNPLLVTNADKVVVVKYQMNWPGSGDPYYTAEGGARKGYYGVNSVPEPFVNGVYAGNQSAIQNAINTGYAQPAQAVIDGYFRVSGDMIYIKSLVTPLISGNSHTIHCIVNEKRTTKNKRNNGETEFFHVMMKMFPGGSGTTLNLTEGTVIPLNYSYDMSTTHVEEMDDLEVVVFVQNKSTKAVLNAAYLVEDNSLPLPPSTLTASQTGETLNINLSWTAVSGASGYNIYRNGVKVNTTPVTGTTYQDVASEYGLTYNYAVAAVAGGVEGFWVTATVLTNLTIPTPINLTVKQLSGKQMLVSWEMPEGFDYPVKYYVFRNGTLLNKDNPISETSMENTGVDYNKEYCFAVQPVLNSLVGGKSTAACITLLEVGICETEKDAMFAIYPNPVIGTLKIQTDETITDCQIFNIQGQLIYSTKSSVKEIATENWATGIYIIRITTEKGTAEKRFVKN